MRDGVYSHVFIEILRGRKENLINRLIVMFVMKRFTNAILALKRVL